MHTSLLFYDDIKEGMVLRTLGRTVTEADVVNFAGISGDWNPIHIDAEFARESIFGRTVVHGIMGMAIATGLMSQAGWFMGSAVAILAIDQWKFLKPIFPGDTLHCEVEIVSRRLTSSGERGLVERKISLINQDGTLVQQGLIPLMIKMRPDA